MRCLWSGTRRVCQGCDDFTSTLSAHHACSKRTPWPWLACCLESHALSRVSHSLAHSPALSPTPTPSQVCVDPSKSHRVDKLLVFNLFHDSSNYTPLKPLKRVRRRADGDRGRAGRCRGRHAVYVIIVNDAQPLPALLHLPHPSPPSLTPHAGGRARIVFLRRPLHTDQRAHRRNPTPWRPTRRSMYL